MKERTKLVLLIAIFLAAYFLPFESLRFRGAIMEGFHLLQEYARLHVLFCLVPAFFIAGAIQNFLSQATVLRYLGPKAPKPLAYGVASVSGAILAVCSCTVLPMFAGIYTAGAGLGPAIAFLYSGPATNVLAIILTARVLGFEIGIARALGAVLFAAIVGLLMAFFFRREETARANSAIFEQEGEKLRRSLGQNILYFLVMIGILVFAAWGKPSQPVGFWNLVYGIKWYLVIGLLVVLGLMLWRWFEKSELKAWVMSTWDFTRKILPLLFAGVFVAGILLGRPGTDSGLIPSGAVAGLVGGNSIIANFFASIAGAFMYFATLTEVPILQGLLGSGMGKGPALSLLLAGPCLSLPSMLVIRSVIGTKKTLVYVCIVVAMATLTGILFGLVAR